MTITERAAKVLQQIDEQLTLEEKASLGPWASHPETLKNGRLFNTIVGSDNFVCNICATPRVHEDATFIAASRTGWPTSLCCLRDAIDGLLKIVADGVRGSDTSWDGCDHPGYVKHLLTTLCDQWEQNKQ